MADLRDRVLEILLRRKVADRFDGILWDPTENVDDAFMALHGLGVRYGLDRMWHAEDKTWWYRCEILDGPATVMWARDNFCLAVCEAIIKWDERKRDDDGKHAPASTDPGTQA